MKVIKFFLPLLFIVLSPASMQAQEEKDDEKEKKKVLVFYKTEGFWHKSIPTGFSLIEDLGEDHGFEVEITKDADDFHKDDLQENDLIIFLSTTGKVFDDEEKAGFKAYMENGGNFFGIHAAADTEKDWEWFSELIGGVFENHPKVQAADVINNAPEHPTVAHLPKVWNRTDEWYNYRDLNPEMNVLLYLDEDSYKGGENGEEHPIAWYRELKWGGVSIYTGGGHTIQSYLEPAFREHLLRCILFALDEDVSMVE